MDIEKSLKKQKSTETTKGVYAAHMHFLGEFFFKIVTIL